MFVCFFLVFFLMFLGWRGFCTMACQIKEVLVPEKQHISILCSILFSHFMFYFFLYKLRNMGTGKR